MPELKKLYDIPIYAISPERLEKRVKEKSEKIAFFASPKHNEQSLKELISSSVSPNNIWNYNHIIGYISISVSNADVWFDLFLPAKEKKKYYWTSNVKVFVRDSMLNGFHFYVTEKMSNLDIKLKTSQMLHDLIKSEMLKQYCVDTKVFESTYNYLDFREVINSLEDKANG